MQPIQFSDVVTLASAEQNSNVIISNPSMRRYLRTPFPCQIQVFVSVSDSDVSFEFSHGAKKVVDLSQAVVRTAGVLNEAEDLINDEIYSQGNEQLTLRAINADASSQTLTYRIVLSPLGEPGQIVQLPGESLVTQRGPIVLTATQVDLQLLDGRAFERASVPSRLDLYLSASASPPTFTLNIGNKNIAPPSRISPQNRMISKLNDLVVGDVEVMPSDIIAVAISNTSGTPNVFMRTELKELMNS